jgi:feruloyl esterase
MMRHRLYLVGAAMGLFAGVAIAGTPAMATPCTNLQSLQIQDTTITSAMDNTTGSFTVPGSNPPSTFTGLPPFCRVTATLTPTSDSSIKIEIWLPESMKWNGRFLGTGGGGFQGVITYGELASGIQAGFASTNSDLGTGSSGCNPLYCGSNGMTNLLATAFGNPGVPTTGLFGHPERIKDFGFRAIHLMTVRGKEIAKAFYNQHADKA